MIEIIESSSASEDHALERSWDHDKDTYLDWRSLLDAFLQEEINDYSFQPPDRRFSNSDFFLPDFNEKEASVKNILFMVDTSASIDQDMLETAYSEMQNGIEQYDGHIQGMLGFFDSKVITPTPFSSVTELKKIRPHGYGGTDFECIFRYVRDEMEELPASIVIFTDGEGDIPEESEAMGIPVLWLLHGEENTPRWGRAAYLTR